MAKPVDPDPLVEKILRVLSKGPASAPEIYGRLGVSQPVFSRAVRSAGERILVVGRARATRYAAPRRIEGVTLPILVYSVRPSGQPPRHLLNLHPIRPEGFYLEPAPGSGQQGRFTEDLPWFLANCRPSGWLGRLLPRRYPAPGVPDDILAWSSDHVLRFATRHGWNLPGALIVGEEAFRTFVQLASSPPDRVERAARERRYPELAADVLAIGPAASSAGGEQPKFLATRDDGEVLVPVLVKFSPPLQDAKAIRTADLLIAEHIAHEILERTGHPTARSTVLRAGNRVFLEIERFDREGSEHRRGVISLGAVDAEFVGSLLDRWTTTTAALVKLGLLSEEDHREVRWLSVFGELIANNDMHIANLSLWLDDTAIAGLAPSYDMLPMAYAVRQNELVPFPFSPQVPAPSDADVARSAWEAAVAFWRTVAAQEEISEGFRRIALENAQKVAALEAALARLPA